LSLGARTRKIKQRLTEQHELFDRRDHRGNQDGFAAASARDLQKRLKPLIRKTQPYTKKIAHRGVWVEPSLLAEIEYRAKSAEGKVRHPVFKGLREDL
jgi:bifunctional non-homologous end joining protein LigD